MAEVQQLVRSCIETKCAAGNKADDQGDFASRSIIFQFVLHDLMVVETDL